MVGVPATGHGVAGLAVGHGEVDDDDARQLLLRSVELVGVGDHRTGAGDGRRESRVDVVGGGGVVAAERVGGDQLPAVERAAAVRQLDAIHVPPIAGVVVAEQVERHLGEHDGVATIAADHREGAVTDSGTWLRLGQLDLAAVRAIAQPHRAELARRPRLPADRRRRRTGRRPKPTDWTRLGIPPQPSAPVPNWSGRPPCAAAWVMPSAATTVLRGGCKQPATYHPSSHHRVPYNSRRRKPFVDASSTQRNTCSG